MAEAVGGGVTETPAVSVDQEKRLAPEAAAEFVEDGMRVGAAHTREKTVAAVDDPGALAAQLAATVGVVEHGLFPATMVSDVIVDRGEHVERIELR